MKEYEVEMSFKKKRRRTEVILRQETLSFTRPIQGNVTYHWRVCSPRNRVNPTRSNFWFSLGTKNIKFPSSKFITLNTNRVSNLFIGLSHLRLTVVLQL